MNREMDISLDNFKKWVRQNKKTEQSQYKYSEQEDNHNYIGLKVKSKISFGKLMNKIEINEGDMEEVCDDFLKEGGIIADDEDVNFLIEVTSGSFYIKHCYVAKN